MKRKYFLSQFLGALGAHELEFDEIHNDYISGTVHYAPEDIDPNDPEDSNCQGFCWHMTEAKVPSHEATNLAAILKNFDLLDINKLRLDRRSLRQMYISETSSEMSLEAFDKVLEELELVVVQMVDDGEETDIFFIHE